MHWLRVDEYVKKREYTESVYQKRLFIRPNKVAGFQNSTSQPTIKKNFKSF